MSANQNVIWKSALVLSIASLFAKVLSVLYRILYQNITGDIGLYIYQQVYPIYGMIMLLSTYGFPVVISKLVAEHKNAEDTAKILSVSFVSIALFSGLLTIVTFLGADWIAVLMGDRALTLPLQTISFLFIFMPFLVVLRGYFQGNQNMYPTATSQIVEQFIRTTTIVILAYMLIRNGYSYYASGAGAFVGSLLGATGAVVVLLIFWKKRDGRVRRGVSTISTKFIIKEIFIVGFYICVSQLFLIMLQFIDSFSIKSILSASGFTEVEAMTTKGVYDRGLPLIQLGITFAIALSVSFVPLVAKMKTWNRSEQLEKKAELATMYRLSIAVSCGATVGLISIMKPTNIMLFKDNSGSVPLSILAVSIIFLSSALTSSAVLQGLGKIQVSAIHIGVGLCLKILLNIVLVPHFAIVGAACATVAACALTAVLNEISLQRIMRFNIFQKKQAVQMFLSLAALALFIIMYQYFLQTIIWIEPGRLFFAFQALSSVLLGGYAYIFLLLHLKVLAKHEIRFLPYDKVISKLFLIK